MKTTAEQRQKIIEENAYLVKIIAGQLINKIDYTLEFDDLVGFGIFGLIDAIDKFDESMNVKFTTYATTRIRGSIIDELRKYDKLSRSMRDQQKTYLKYKDLAQNTYQRTPTREDIKIVSNLSEEEFKKLESSYVINTSLDEVIDDPEIQKEPDRNIFNQPTYVSPELEIEKEELKNALDKGLSHLTEKEKQTILLSYYEELTQSEIAAVLGVTASRVSMLHKTALLKMKEHLKDYAYLLGV